jgi:hypothetical protein|tara:strand:- start:2811 stop:2933 length:123 start_codon:yes stop_codon:yes gene_type:complete
MSNFEGMLVIIGVGLLALSPDVINWVCDKIADGFNKDEEK